MGIYTFARCAVGGVFMVCLIVNLCKAQETQPLFTRLSPEQTGVRFANTLTETPELNIITYEYFFNGGGVAIGDLNNDDLPDIYLSGNMVPNRLYLNKGGLKFEDITEKAGVACREGWKTGVTMADVNADGWLDIYVCLSGNVVEKERQNKLFINNGDLTFSEKGKDFGLDLPDYSTQAAFLDYDRDGDLDLFLLDHNVIEVRRFDMSAQKKVYHPHAGDRLLRNDKGRYVDVTRQAGIIANPISYGLGVAVSDINSDGWPDIYVSNDYLEQDYLYINNMDGTFTNRLEEMMGHISNFSMGSDVSDVNNDGLTDIFTVDMLPETNRRQKLLFAPDNYENYQAMLDHGFYHQLMRNMLQLNNGDGTFSEVGQLSGVSNTDWSWAALFADFDNDGLKDLFVTNGYGRDVINRDFMKFYISERFKSLRGVENKELLSVLQDIPPTAFPNYVYKNEGKLRFTNRSAAWGINDTTLSNGTACADLDGDGDLDLVVNNINEVAGVYENHAGELKGNHYLQVSLQSNTPNRFGIGTKVMVISGDNTQLQEFYPSRGFQSAMHVPLHFGLKAEKADRVKVVWPDGKVQLLENVKADRRLILKHEHARLPESTDKGPSEGLPAQPGNTKSQGSPPGETSGPLLAEALHVALPFRHREDNFNDFKIQPLLPNMISYSGPHMTQGDFNGDSLIDLYLCGAKGQGGSLLLQNIQGGFIASRQNILETDALAEDTDALFFDADGDADPDLYVCSGGFAYQPNDPALQDRLYFNVLNGVLVKREGTLPEMPGSTSCVTAADIDKDGDTDLFAGGRVIPGRYPETPESYLLRNNGKGVFSIVTDSLAPDLKQAGMVTDAVFTDINKDSWPDLVVVGEWMPVKVFINRQGKLVEQSSEWIAPPTKGWWHRILADDMDNDGDADLVIGNLGLNSQVKASPAKPATLHYADFDQNGSVDPVMCYYIGEQSYPSASRDEITNQMVSLRKKFPDYASYARATIGDVLSGEQQKMAKILQVTHLETSYFENTGSGFTLHALPVQANFAPVCAIAASDLNNDGLKDLILAGNMTHTRIKFGKYDAGYGTVLLNQGNDRFEYIPQTRSGLCIKGDVRDIRAVRIGTKTCLLFARNNDTVAVYLQEQPNQ